MPRLAICPPLKQNNKSYCPESSVTTELFLTAFLFFQQTGQTGGKIFDCLYPDSIALQIAFNNSRWSGRTLMTPNERLIRSKSFSGSAKTLLRKEIKMPFAPGVNLVNICLFTHQFDFNSLQKVVHLVGSLPKRSISSSRISAIASVSAISPIRLYNPSRTPKSRT